MAFDLSTFILDGLLNGIKGGQSRFVIAERSGSWMMQGVLSSEQMQQVSDALDARDAAEQAAKERAEAEALAAKYAEWDITEQGLEARTIDEMKAYYIARIMAWA